MKHTPPARPSSRYVGLLAALITLLIWTFFIIIGRASSARTLAPTDVGLLRILGANAVLLPWAWWTVRQARRTQPRYGSFFGLSPLPWRPTILAGFFGSFAYAALVYTAFFFAPATHAAVLLPGSLPLWMTLLACIVLGEKITRLRAWGLVLILAGGLLVGGRSLLHSFHGSQVWIGDLLFLTSACSWGVYSVLVRKYALPAIEATMGISVFGLLSFTPLFMLGVYAGWLPTQLHVAPWQEIAFQMLFQGVGAVAIAGITFTIMVNQLGPVRSSMITALVPSLAALGAVVLLDEQLSWNLLAGLACVTGGIFLGVRAPRTAPPTND